MIEILIWLVIFAAALFALIKSSDMMIESAEKIGVSLGIPHFILGITIVATGTSIPELAASVIAVLEGSTEVVVSNVVGSNIANVFLIIGAVSIFSSKTRLKFKLTKVDLAVFIFSALMLVVTIMDGVFSFVEGVVMILVLASYFYYTLNRPAKESDSVKRRFMFKELGILVLSSGIIYFGASYSIKALLELSGLLNVGAGILTIVLLALGTSLPELVVGARSAMKGNPDLAFGNILGSNIFNSLAVMGVPALISSLIVPKQVISIALPVMLAGTCIFIMISGAKKVYRWQGFVLLSIYAGFLLVITGVLTG